MTPGRALVIPEQLNQTNATLVEFRGFEIWNRHNIQQSLNKLHVILSREFQAIQFDVSGIQNKENIEIKFGSVNDLYVNNLQHKS